MNYSFGMAGSPREFLKRWKLGSLFYRLYYRPKGFLERCFRRGLLNWIIDAQSQQQMEMAVYQLKSIVQQSTTESLNIYFLTGKKFWYQTCFCAYSMAQHTHLRLQPVIFDDGSLEPSHQTEIQRIFPNAQIILKSEIAERINTYLPAHQFPYLHERRQNYPNIRKLTDIHIGSTGWKLVLDSDMLFFRPPTHLLHWLQNPQQPCHMVDVETAYGYPNDFMQTLASAPITERINVGICGLKSEDIDWEKLEYWCKTMIETHGTHYYQEQALIAMLMAGQSCTVVPVEDYIVMPNRAEVMHPKAILHHYVADSKPWYFRYGWRQAVESECAFKTSR
jgi:hypothetical protein